MGDDGYTLAESLAAMMVLSLAMGALWAGVGAFSSLQGRVAQTLEGPRRERQAHSALNGLGALLDHGGGAEARALTGEPQRMQFDCGRPRPCGAEIVPLHDHDDLRLSDGDARRTMALPKGVRHEFRYWGDQEEGNWPPAKPSLSRLRAISLREAGSGQVAPAVIVKLWRDEPVDCVYDSVKQGCRL